MTTETLFDAGDDTGNEPTSYHDARCQCQRHCENCRRDLDEHGGVNAGPRARYCSTYCKGRAARERAFDRYMQAQVGAQLAAAEDEDNGYDDERVEIHRVIQCTIDIHGSSSLWDGPARSCNACVAPTIWGDDCHYCARYRRPCGRHNENHTH